MWTRKGPRHPFDREGESSSQEHRQAGAWYCGQTHAEFTLENVAAYTACAAARSDVYSHDSSDRSERKVAPDRLWSASTSYVLQMVQFSACKLGTLTAFPVRFRGVTHSVCRARSPSSHLERLTISQTLYTYACAVFSELSLHYLISCVSATLSTLAIKYVKKNHPARGHSSHDPSWAPMPMQHVQSCRLPVEQLVQSCEDAWKQANSGVVEAKITLHKCYRLGGDLMEER